MLNELKLLTGPKVTLDQIRWRGQQIGRGLRVGEGLVIRDHQNLAIKACNFFDARPNFEMNNIIKLKNPDDWPIGKELRVVKARENVGGLVVDKPRMFFDLEANWLDHAFKVPAPAPVDIDNICPEVLEPKQSPFAKLQAHWKAAQGKKPGLPHNHPAFKGVFRGRDPARFDDRLKSFKLEMPKLAGFNFDDVGPRGVINAGIGIGGLFDHWNNMFAPRVPTNTAMREERKAAAAFRDAMDKQREYEQERINAQFEDTAGSYVRILLKQLEQPGADVCQLIANMYAKVKTHRYHAKSTRKLIYSGLVALGYRILGNGHFSSAFQGPDGFVYKVNCNHKDSDAWYVYAVNTMYYGESLSCVPKIDAIAYRDKTYCVKMEVLHPLTMQDFSEFENLNDAFRGSGDVEGVIKNLQVSRDDAIEMMHIIDRTKRETRGSRLDIHYQNVMYRIDANNNKTLVLTDPLAYGDFEMKNFDERLTAVNFVASREMKQAA